MTDQTPENNESSPVAESIARPFIVAPPTRTFPFPLTDEDGMQWL